MKISEQFPELGWDEFYCVENDAATLKLVIRTKAICVQSVWHLTLPISITRHSFNYISSRFANKKESGAEKGKNVGLGSGVCGGGFIRVVHARAADSDTGTQPHR